MKKLFLVFFVMLIGIAGLSAAPPGEDGVDDALRIVMPQADITAWDAAPGVQAPMRPGGGFDMTQAVELICLWSEQYRQGLLTQGEFKTLVAGRIAVINMREQTIEAMQRIASLAPDEFPLLC